MIFFFFFVCFVFSVLWVKKMSKRSVKVSRVFYGRHFSNYSALHYIIDLIDVPPRWTWLFSIWFGQKGGGLSLGCTRVEKFEFSCWFSLCGLKTSEITRTALPMYAHKRLNGHHTHLPIIQKIDLSQLLFLFLSDSASIIELVLWGIYD